MRKIACAVLVMILVFSALMFIQPTHAAYVNGNINYNTTWTRSNSPYQLTANVIVNPGVTLTIDPGVTVNLGSYQLQVNGILNARGASNNKILFTSSSLSSQKIEFSSSSTNWNEGANSGCIIDNAIINWVLISVNGASTKISNNYITASTSNMAITVSGGSPNISNNVVLFNQANGIYITGGSPTISGNTISGQQLYDAINIQSLGSATISNNNILNGYNGVNAAGYCTIIQNNFKNNQNDAIHSTNAGTVIQNNAIDSNSVGISGASGTLGIVQNNTISNNWKAGIWSPRTSTFIRYNNIVNNYENVHLTENGVNVEATDNWWGTADTEAINQTIWDHKSAQNLGTVNFVPFLTQLNPQAPTVPSSIPVPTPPPTPAPTSTASPTPTATTHPTPTPTWAPTPTQQPYATPTPYEYYPTPTSPIYETPYPTPTQTPGEISNEGGEMDLTSVAVIVVAVMATIVIVFTINRAFVRGGRTQTQPPANST